MKRISSKTTIFTKYIVLVMLLVMMVIPILSGGLTHLQLFIILLLGYVPVTVVIIYLLSIYVDVFYDESKQAFLIKKQLFKKSEEELKRQHIIKLGRLGINRISMTYYIKYKNNQGKTRFFVFTKKLFVEIETIE